MQWVITDTFTEALAGVASFWADAPGFSFVPAPPEPPAEPPAEPAEPEPTWRCSRCRRPLPASAYSTNQRKKSGAKRKCHACTAGASAGASAGKCVYCGRFGTLTKEHLLPKSVGGKLTVKACRACNQARGDRGDFAPFLGLIRRRPDLWTEHVAASANPPNTRRWLRAYDLLEPV
jgi:5-methylcytosine-specific restriction endonuclease McrA